MTTHYIKKGDTLPKLSTQFTDSSGVGAPIANGAIVSFRMRLHTAAPGVYKVNAAAQVDDATTGKVSYTFTSQDTNAPGIYFAEFVVTLGGSVQTIPTTAFNTVWVTDHL